MTRRADREAAKLTMSWLPDAGVREVDLIATVKPLAKMPGVSRPAPALPVYQSPAQEKRAALLAWAGEHCFPHMIVRLSRLRLHVIQAGTSSWHSACRESVIEIIEGALEQSEHFQPVSEETYRGALACLGHWRKWEQFSFKPSNLRPGYQMTLFIGDGTEEAWMRFARCGLFPHIVEACELLEDAWNASLLAWADDHGWPEFTYCRANGEEGKIPAGAENWSAFLDETDDQDRIQMAIEVTDLDELEAGREE